MKDLNSKLAFFEHKLQEWLDRLCNYVSGIGFWSYKEVRRYNDAVDACAQSRLGAAFMLG